MFHSSPSLKGFSLVEILVAASIFLGAVVAFTGSIHLFYELARHTGEVTQAGLLLEEGGEAVQLMRDNGWDAQIEPLALETEYHLYWNGSMYKATTTPQVQSGFRRTIVMHAVRRDGSDSISESGTIDSDTRLVGITIRSAVDNRLITYAESLVHNIYDN